MTDRYFALTVILEDTIREDDAKYIMDAIRMIRGVVDIKAHVATPEVYWAQADARQALAHKLWDIVKDEL